MNVRDAKALQVIPQTKLRSSMPRASDAISCAKSLYDRFWREADIHWFDVL
jgi:hypothetical protein